MIPIRIMALLLVLFWPVLTMAISGADLLRLKNAGVTDETIALMVAHKTLETYALSVSEIEALKQAGVAEETLRMLVQEGSFMKNATPLVYGTGTQKVRLATVQDLIRLKQAGFGDEVLQAIVLVAGSDIAESDRRRAWEMLQQMGLYIETKPFRE